MDFSAPQIQLILAAERLFAAEGIEAVSTRRISSEAGQRNNSALQYHFGSKEGVVEAIFQYRMPALHTRRIALLETAKSLRDWLAVIIQPFAEHLMEDPQENCYIGFMARYVSRYQLLPPLPGRDPAAHQALKQAGLAIRQHQAHLPTPVIDWRLQFVSRTAIQTLAQWDHWRRHEAQHHVLTPEFFNALLQNLLDVLEGALKAPCHEASAGIPALFVYPQQSAS